MSLDLIAITLLALGFIRGFRKGIIVAAFSVLAIIVGTIAALKLSGTISTLLFDGGKKGGSWAPLLTYVLVFIGVVWLVRWCAKLIEGAAGTLMLGLVNKLVGGLLYAFIAAFVWSSVLYLAGGARLISAETIAASKTYPYLAPVAPWVFAHIGMVLPFVKNIFADLQHFFDGVNSHVGTP